jgi:hypothetical protein
MASTLERLTTKDPAATLHRRTRCSAVICSAHIERAAKAVLSIPRHPDAMVSQPADATVELGERRMVYATHGNQRTAYTAHSTCVERLKAHHRALRKENRDASLAP